jgi:hypothetical protein
MLSPDAERAAPAVTGNGSQNGAVAGAGTLSNSATSATPQSSADPAALNGETHLYRHFNKDGALLYVGISINALCRLKRHEDVSSWFDEIHRVDIERFSSREAALTAECEAIKRETPLHNVRHNRHTKADPTVTNRHLGLTRVELFAKICKPVYTIEQVAVELGVRRSTVNNLIALGKLGYITIPSGLNGWRPFVRITGWQLIDYLEYLMRGSARRLKARAAP